MVKLKEVTTISILSDTKKVLGIADDYDVFDTDIKMHINATIATLTQLGVGPLTGFTVVSGDETWETFLGTDPKLNHAQTYIYNWVRLRFDPPSSSHAVTAIKEDIRELEWRLNVTMEKTLYVDPEPVPAEESVLDGGGP